MEVKLATAKHISALIDEIVYLNSQIQETDTGHIHTAISVLRNHVEQLLKEIKDNG